MIDRRRLLGADPGQRTPTEAGSDRFLITKAIPTFGESRPRVQGMGDEFLEGRDRL